MDGILIVDKPQKLTSHDVVARLRRILKTKRIGHTGTLDPFATGVLVMLVGKATRLAQFLDKDAKEYEAVVRLGFSTDTGDRTGELKDAATPRHGNAATVFSVGEIEAVLTHFLGEIEQTPPMYSAKKVDGKKLYELARQGIEIERKAVRISISELQITDYELPENQHLALSTQHSALQTQDFGLKVLCSAGTYIRVLAEDIGEQLGTKAHLAELRRTRAGKFDLSQAVTLEELETIVAENKLNDVLISMNEAVSHLPEIVLSEREIEDTKNGKRLRFENVELAENQTMRMIDAAENLIAVGFYAKAENFVQPKLVLI